MRGRISAQINNAILARRCGLAFFPVEQGSTGVQRSRENIDEKIDDFGFFGQK
jgi:hypothetical protein